MKLIGKTKINFLNKKNLALSISCLLICSGFISLIINSGPKLSIDFTGGRVTQVLFSESPVIPEIRLALEKNGLGGAEVIEFGSANELLIKTGTDLNNDQTFSNFKNAFSGKEYEIRRVEMVGPKIGTELSNDAVKAIFIALIGIMLYIWFRFDRFYAVGSVAALIHDVMITIGVFSILDKEIDLSIIAAFLTIVGYSLNDTIVVFDRIRENIHQYSREKLENVVNISLNETLSRTVITSMTTLIVVVVLLVWGGEVIHNFAFALTIGILVGTYSSIFVASPVMVYLENRYGQKLAEN